LIVVTLGVFPNRDRKRVADARMNKPAACLNPPIVNEALERMAIYHSRAHDQSKSCCSESDKNEKKDNEGTVNKYDGS
jgi:hypothetical protein